MTSLDAFPELRDQLARNRANIERLDQAAMQFCADVRAAYGLPPFPPSPLDPSGGLPSAGRVSSTGPREGALVEPLDPGFR